MFESSPLQPRVRCEPSVPQRRSEDGREAVADRNRLRRLGEVDFTVECEWLGRNYERAAKDDPRFEAVLLRERIPTPLAGNALVIVDSADTPAARLNAPDDAADATSAGANSSGQTAPQL